MAEAFRYTPLRDPRSFRVIQLYPRLRESNDIRCTLITAGLERSVRYEALSYCWGTSSTKDYRILCNGVELSVNRNTHDAIRALVRDYDRFLWIDSICINQADIDERSQQITLMAQIYSYAKRVLIWLDDRDVLLDTHLSPEWPHASVDYKPADPRSHVSSKPSDPTSSLLRLLGNRWFSRVWVLQEVMLARSARFVLHDGEVDWDSFWQQVSVEISSSNDLDVQMLARPALKLYALSFTSRTIKFVHDDPFGPWLRDDMGLRDVAIAELGRILEFSLTLEASDPRDRIYALLGLCEPLEITLPVPDYSKTAATVYREARLALQQKGKPFGKVSLPFRPQHLTPDGTSSWVLLSDSSSPDSNSHSHSPSSPAAAPAQDFGLKVRFQASHPTPTNHVGDEKRHIQHPQNRVPGKYPCEACHQPSSLVSEGLSGSRPASPHCDVSSTITTCDKDSQYASICHQYFQEVVDHYKQQLWQCVLRNLPRSVLNELAGISCHGSQGQISRQTLGTSSSNTARSGSGSGSADGNDRKQPQQSQMRRRKRGDDDEGGNEPPKKQTKKQVDPNHRLACPYFQRNPEGAGLKGACSGPGWDTVSRVKEHLYRDHRIYQCLRCGRNFDSMEFLQQHSQTPAPCIQQDLSSLEKVGIDESQALAIRVNRKATWYDVYKILFPNDRRETYPSQHYCRGEFLHFFEDFHRVYQVTLEAIVPDRLAREDFFRDISPRTRDTLLPRIRLLVAGLWDHFLESYRHRVLRSPMTAQRARVNLAVPAPLPRASTPIPVIALFDQYLHQTAPDGTFADGFPGIPAEPVPQQQQPAVDGTGHQDDMQFMDALNAIVPDNAGPVLDPTIQETIGGVSRGGRIGQAQNSSGGHGRTSSYGNGNNSLSFFEDGWSDLDMA